MRTSINPAVRSAQKMQSPFIVRAELRGRSAIEQMADDLRVLAANASGAVTADDLELRGWSGTQIELHGKPARTLALKQSAGAP